MIKIIKFYKFTIIYSIIIFVHIFLLTRLIFFPYPELFIYSYLTDKGLIPYKQIFDQHFPGIMFLPVNLFSLGITTLHKMRFIHLGVTLFTDIVFLKVSEKIFKKRMLVALSLMVFAFWQIYLEGHVLWIESFITPLLLISFLMQISFEEMRDRHYLYASAFTLGVAIVFKQTVLPLLFLIFVYMVVKKYALKKVLFSLLISFIPIIFVLLYFYKIEAIKDFYYWTITFNLTIFAQMGKTTPSLTDLIKMVPIFGMGILSTVILFVKRQIRDLILPVIYFIGSLFFVYARFDFIHLQPALPFAVLITLLFLAKLRSKILPPLIIVYLAISLYIFIPNFRFNNKPGISPMFNDPVTQELIRKVNFYRNNSDTVFALGSYPHIYYLTVTLPPGKIFTFQFPWFMKINEAKILAGIIENPPYLIIRDEESQIGGYKLIDYMQNINKYIDINYKLVDSAGSNEILLKK